MESAQNHEEKAKVPAQANPSDSRNADEVSHVHEAVKDIDELIAAMDDLDEGMPEKDEETPEEEAKAPSEKEEPAPEIVEDSDEVKAAKERLAQIKGKVLTLRWDMEHGQITPAKKAQYEKLKPEYEKLVKIIEDAGQKA